MDVQSATAAFSAATLFFATIVTIGANLPPLKAIKVRVRSGEKP
jgi:hypothetical protein